MIHLTTDEALHIARRTFVVLEGNGRRLTATNDQADEFIVAIAEGRLDSVPDISDAPSRLVTTAE
ncbi:hypothetical protein [Curtobacterium pusillum]|uniref:hypothetical protein n=1 Tax=Curtobacterium pusillum TaxID=69373 RepID=UPI0011A950BC|nr:hypothetical protein [Curtobacterium pusillum]